MEGVVLKGTLDKSVAAIGLVFSFTLANYVQVLDSPEEPAAYCYEGNQALLSGALGVDGQGKPRGVYIAHYQIGSGAVPFTLAGYEVTQSSLTVNNRKVKGLCDLIRKGEKIKLLEPNR